VSRRSAGGGHRGRRGVEQRGIEMLAPPGPPATRGRARRQIDRPVESQHAGPVPLSACRTRRGALGIEDHGKMRGRAAMIRAIHCKDAGRIFRRGNHAGPGVEDLHRIGAAAICICT